MTQEEQDPFDVLSKALTEDREKAIDESNDVYALIKQKIDNFIKRSGRKLITEYKLQIVNPYRITGKVLIESKEYDEYIIKRKYVGKIRDFDVVIVTSKYYSSMGKSVLELTITAYKQTMNNEEITDEENNS